MAICKECGARIPDESRFCWHCGAPQREPRPESRLIVWLRRHALLASVGSSVVVFGVILGLVALFGGTPYWGSWVIGALVLAASLGISDYYSLVQPRQQEWLNPRVSALFNVILLLAVLCGPPVNLISQNPPLAWLIRFLIGTVGVAGFSMGRWAYQPPLRAPREERPGK